MYTYLHLCTPVMHVYTSYTHPTYTLNTPSLHGIGAAPPPCGGVRAGAAKEVDRPESPGTEEGRQYIGMGFHRPRW